MLRSSQAKVDDHWTAVTGSPDAFASEETPSSSDSASSSPFATEEAAERYDALSLISTRWSSGSTATFCCTGVRSGSIEATRSGPPTQVPPSPEPVRGGV